MKRTLAPFVAACLTIVALAVAGPIQVAPVATAATSTNRFEALQPCRIADQRTGAGLAFLDANRARIRTDVCDIPSDASAIVVVATITNPGSRGWLIPYPAGAATPTAATLNWDARTTRANTTTVLLGQDRQIEIFRSDGFGAGAVILDVVGAFIPTTSATSGRLVTLDAPQRLIDTRETDTPMPSNSTLRIALPDGVPADASALAVNVTVANSTRSGFFTTFPAGTDRPTASMLNTDGPGQTRAAATIVPVSAEGFDVYASRGAHLIVDVTGWFTGDSAPDAADGLFVASVPTRLRDTRPEIAPIYPRGSIAIPLQANMGAPAALAISVTMVSPDTRGYITAHAARTPIGETSSGYGMAREVTAQFGIIAASSAGIEIFSFSGTELTVDVVGWFTGQRAAMTEPAVAGNPVPRLNVIAIGDSTLAGIDRNYAWAQLRGANFDLRARSCRRLIRASCKGREGPIPPPNALDELRSLPYGAYDIAVIMTGYNDGPSDIARGLPIITQAARDAGIRRVIWLTHAREFPSDKGGSAAGKQTYAAHNAAIRSYAASRYDVIAVEWSRVVRQAPFWLYFDGIHLDKYGGHGNADFISRAVAFVAGVPCPMPTTPGGPTVGRCPDPGFQPPIDIARLYGV